MTHRSTVVADASLVLAMLLHPGAAGRWAASVITEHALVAPELMPAEAANALRKAVIGRTVGQGVAALALADVLDLRVAYYPFAPFAERVWELRTHVTSYDAWYVALAERLDVPLATLDRRLARASGVRCEVRTPDED